MRSVELLLLVSIAAASAALAACSDGEGGGRDTGQPSDVRGDDDAAADVANDPAADAGDGSAEPDAGTDTSEPDAGDALADTGDDTLADTAPDGLSDVETDTAPDGADATADGDAGGDDCTTACDCPQGEACVGGACELASAAVFCCTQPECTAGVVCVGPDEEVATCGATLAATFGDVVFNEVLIDGASDGDPNGDGEGGDPVGDEFVELVNRSEASVDLAGYTLVEITFPAVPRHSFGDGAVLAPGDAIVVFGGGSAPDDIPGARFVVANADDVGVAFGLSLNNDADTLRLLAPDGDLVAVFAWGVSQRLAPLADESYTRAPDLTGDFVPHSEADAERLFSPGLRADGTSF